MTELTREQLRETLMLMAHPETDGQHYATFHAEVMAHDATLRARLEGVHLGHHSACAPTGYHDSDGVPHPPICHPDCQLQRAEILDAQLATAQASVRELEEAMSEDVAPFKDIDGHEWRETLDDGSTVPIMRGSPKLPAFIAKLHTCAAELTVERDTLTARLTLLEQERAAITQAISVEFAKKVYTDEDRAHHDLLENLGVFLGHHQDLEARCTRLEEALKAMCQALEIEMDRTSRNEAGRGPTNYQAYVVAKALTPAADRRKDE